MAREDALEYPEARITLSVKCENGDLESGLQQLHGRRGQRLAIASRTAGATSRAQRFSVVSLMISP
jgi:hypothetical protein